MHLVHIANLLEKQIKVSIVFLRMGAAASNYIEVHTVKFR